MAQATQETIIVAWHDNRTGSAYQIFSAMNANGSWNSSSQGGSDSRVTSTQSDSLFPRLASDSQGNVRVVYEDFRRGKSNPWIYLDSYLASAQQWNSSAAGGIDVPVSATGTAQSLFPAIAIDQAGSVNVAWQDNRNSGIFQVFASYCPVSTSTVTCLVPLCSAPSAFIPTTVQIVDCATGEEITFASTQQVCLRVTAPNATFVRVANESGAFTNWTPFQPNADLDTMVIPWTLSCGNGSKTVCVQVQDAANVGYASCQNISLQATLPSFAISFFQDGTLATPLPTFNGRPVAAAGDVFVTLTSSVPLTAPPTFDIMSGSRETISNQQTVPLSSFVFSGASGFSGSSGASGASRASAMSGASGFSGTSYAAANTQFVGKFTVSKSDGFFHVDGLARLIPHGTATNGESF